MPELAADGGEAGRGAVERIDGTSVVHRPDAVADNADRQIIEAVIVEVAHGQGASEPVTVPGGTADPGDVLMPDLVSGGGKASRRAVDRVDHASTHGRSDALAGNADRQVIEAVVIEVTDGQGAAEGIAVLRGYPATPAAVLVPKSVLPRSGRWPTRGAG